MKTCFHCGERNEDSAVVCRECGKALGTSAAAGLKDPSLDPVIVGTFENTEHAGVLRAELEAAGIEAWTPEDFSIEFPPQSATVQVAAKDAEAATEIAAEFRKAIAEDLPKKPANPKTVEPAATLGPGKTKCVSCGAIIPIDSILCPTCGWTQPRVV